MILELLLYNFFAKKLSFCVDIITEAIFYFEWVQWPYYGSTSVFSFSSGGALKPTDVDTLWVHVTCAWFQPEVSFASDEKMEPALGILSIPSNSFVKVKSACNQIILLIIFLRNIRKFRSVFFHSLCMFVTADLLDMNQMTFAPCCQIIFIYSC